MIIPGTNLDIFFVKNLIKPQENFELNWIFRLKTNDNLLNY